MPDDIRVATRSTGTAKPAPRRRTASRPPREALQVRPATIEDLVAVAGLRLALLREEALNPLFASPHPDAGVRARRLTRAQLRRPDEVFLLALRSGAPVGLLRCRAARTTPLVRTTRHAVVTTAYVVPRERRRGVLRALLDAADAWCRDRHLAGMRLHVGFSNTAGRAAWSSLGFVPAELRLVRTVPQP